VTGAWILVATVSAFAVAGLAALGLRPRRAPTARPALSPSMLDDLTQALVEASVRGLTSTRIAGRILCACAASQTAAAAGREPPDLSPNELRSLLAALHLAVRCSRCRRGRAEAIVRTLAPEASGAFAEDLDNPPPVARTPAARLAVVDVEWPRQ